MQGFFYTYKTMIASIVWDLSPEIVEGFHVRWYGLLFALGFLGAYQVLQTIFKREGHSMETLDGLTFAAFIGTLIGARLGHCLFYEPAYYLSHPLDILKVWEGGLASHGGVIGVLSAFWIYAKRQKLDYWWVLSRAAIVTPITGACIRLGNLANSEIYGFDTDLPWGFIFIHARETVAKHPTQLYEASAYFLLSLGMLWYYFAQSKQGKPAGTFNFIGTFLIGIFGARFLIEFVKYNQVDFESSMFLNMGQMLSIPFIIAGIVAIYVHFKQAKA